MSHSFVRRKLWWKGPGRAEIDFGKTPGSDIVAFHWTKITSYVEGVEETGYRLYWATEEIESYATLTALKIWLVKSAYGTKPGHLVPSELLHDAGLGYFNTNIWVDAWDTPEPLSDQSYLVIEGVEDIEVPKHRHIHLISDGNNSRGGRRRIEPPPPKHRSKVRALSDEIDRIAGSYVQKYGVSRPKVRINPRDEGNWERWERPKKADIYPARAENGSNFSPVGLDWEDLAWEARCARAPREAETPDEECFFILTVENEENP